MIKAEKKELSKLVTSPVYVMLLCCFCKYSLPHFISKVITRKLVITINNYIPLYSKAN